MTAYIDPSAAISLADKLATKYELGADDLLSLIEQFVHEVEPALQHEDVDPSDYVSSVMSAISLRMVASRSPKRTEFLHALQDALNTLALPGI